MAKKNYIFFITLGLICIFENGCAVLNLPFKAIGIAMDIVGEAFKLAQKLPTPPPGVFF